jgi:UDP-N-acetylmuramoyl-tripeptide--D-alanyl-D-alanine ligase
MVDADLVSEWTLSAQEVAAAIDGKLKLIGGGGLNDSAFRGIGTDTRVDLSGLLFFALKGDAHDAHAFLNAAVEKRAAGLVVHRELTPTEIVACETKARETGMPVALIVVKDTLVALQELARHWRHKCRAMILGITGTNGKTSTKEFAAALLATRFKVQFSKGSFNNHWGVPISLLSVHPDHDVAVIEMGMNHPGELKTLSRLVDADAVVCTMVGRGHLEGVGSIEGVAAAKSEIYQYATRTATFIFNLDNEYTAAMMGRFASEGRRVVTFGEGADASGGGAGDVSFRVTSMTPDELTVEGEIKGVAGTALVPVFGQHNVTNLMAAASLALVAGMSPQEIWKALPNCKSAWGRNQWVRLKSGARALFDGYNANPESMDAAISNSTLMLSSEKKSGFARGIAVLGEMREMGEHAASVHEELGQSLRGAGFSEIVFIGPSFESVRRGFGVGNTTAGVAATFVPSYDPALAIDLRSRLKGGDYVLLKGSRGMNLEVFLEALEPLDFKKK